MYFDKPGKDNTEQTLAYALERGKALGLKEVVVASTTGETAYKAMEVFDGFRLTVVTYHCGFKEPFKNRMADDVRKDIEGKGIRVISSSHALSGVERSVAKKHGGVYPVLLIADTLRLFGQGNNRPDAVPGGVPNGIHGTHETLVPLGTPEAHLRA